MSGNCVDLPYSHDRYMDDLYGNVWGDLSADQSYPLPTWNTQPPPPTSPSLVEDDQDEDHVSDEENDDLSTEKQPRADMTTDEVPWPVEETRVSHHPSWMSVPPTNIWNSMEQPQTPTVQAHAPSDDVPPKSPSPTLPTLPEEPMDQHTTLPDRVQDTPVQSRVPSPDQFGTFESGGADAAIPGEEVRWDSPKYSTLDGSVDSFNAWGRQAPEKERDAEFEPADEWEAAKRVKEKLDKRVPPEVIASILETLGQFSERMWPENSPSSPQSPEEWLQSWRRGFDGVDDLNALINTLLPEHSFAPRVPFTKSAIATEMNKSLHLTRHSAITRLSPMAHFMRNKGSSSDWEIAVKNRSSEVPDDMPVGWRIMEKKEVPAPAEIRKRSGLFSSFWNRREGSTTSPPGVLNVKPFVVPYSPIEPSPTFTAECTGTPPIISSRRASRSPSQSTEERRPQSVSGNRLTKPPPVPPVITASVSVSSTKTASPVLSTPGDVSGNPIDPIVTTDGPAQSAVSRFLNRFSRPKPTFGNDSLLLSSDDLDFLSDVPVVNSADGVSDEDDDMPLGKQKVIMESKQGAVLSAPLTLIADTPNHPSSREVVDDDFDALFNAPIFKPQKAQFQTSSQPSSIVEQRGTSRPPSTTPQTNTQRNLPNPVRPQTPSFPVVRMASTPSVSSSRAVPFLIPPPPSSRPATPKPSTTRASPSSTTSIPTLPQPPSQKPAEVNLFYDDDEFCDFLSLGQQQPPTNGTRDRETTSPSAPVGPLGSLGSLNMITPSTSRQPILYTSNSSNSLMVSPVSDTADDAWGFDNFEELSPATSITTNSLPSRTGTPPTTATAHQLSAPRQWLSKPSPPPPPVPSKSGSSTPSSLTNSPLGPPPKSQSTLKQRPPPFNLPGSDKKPPPHPRSHSRRVSAEDHSHTMQLMNNASKRGAWPAPLSPLPEALAPPPPPSSTVNSPLTAVPSSKALLDMEEDDEPFSQAQGKSLRLNSTVSVIGPSEDGGGVNFSNTGPRGSGRLLSIPPLPGFTNTVQTQPKHEQSLLDFGDFESPRTTSVEKPTSLRDKSGGGLSAQDLSFFEGF